DDGRAELGVPGPGEGASALRGCVAPGSADDPEGGGEGGLVAVARRGGGALHRHPEGRSNVHHSLAVGDTAAEDADGGHHERGERATARRVGRREGRGGLHGARDPSNRQPRVTPCPSHRARQPWLWSNPALVKPQALEHTQGMSTILVVYHTSEGQ